MNKEDKELLLKDLCARLPFGVKVCCNNTVYNIDAYTKSAFMLAEPLKSDVCLVADIEEIKPYLFPLSSMTMEQRYELHDLIHNLNMLAINGEIGDWIVSSSEIDWYNKNHFDYRCLIEKGLSIDATGLNIY